MLLLRHFHGVRAALAGVAMLAGIGAAVAQTAPVATIPAYTLGALDQIEVYVANLPELTTKTRINEDNSVILPLIGRLVIGGLTTDAAVRDIEARYRAGGYINAPSVRIEVAEYQSRKVSVLGQVTTQGLIPLDRSYSFAEILARAGGLTGDAADEAFLVRPTTGGGNQRTRVDLTQIATGQGATLVVKAGDVIFVPKAPTFSVIGAVNKAGVYRLSYGMTVQQALATAGDVARIGRRSGFKIRRKGSDGVAVVVQVKAEDAVQADDVIVVRERIF